MSTNRVLCHFECSREIFTRTGSQESRLRREKTIENRIDLVGRWKTEDRRPKLGVARFVLRVVSGQLTGISRIDANGSSLSFRTVILSLSKGERSKREKSFVGVRSYAFRVAS